MKLFVQLFVNSLANYTANRIALEALAILEENLVVADMCTRQYDSDLADWGDVVQYRKPSTLTAARIPENGSVTVQDLTDSGGTVKLDQHVSNAFTITDRQAQRSFADVAAEHIAPAVRACAELVDAIVMGCMYQFMGNPIADNTGTPAYNDLVDANTKMTRLLVPRTPNRQMVINPGAEGAFLKEDKLTRADAINDGSALLNGFVGKGSGFDLRMSQTAPELAVNNQDNRAGAATAGFAVGATVIDCDGFTGVGHAGMWLTINGVPYQASAVDDTAGNMDEITIIGGLRDAILDNAVIVVMDLATQLTVDSDAQVAGYIGGIAYTGDVIAPQVGQGLTFGTEAATNAYSIVAVAGGEITLNRPLDNTLGATASINLMPNAGYNWAFHKPSVALVQRPMGVSGQDGGVDIAVVSTQNLGLRIQMDRTSTNFRKTFVIDLLCGVKVIDNTQGIVLIGS